MKLLLFVQGKHPKFSKAPYFREPARESAMLGLVCPGRRRLLALFFRLGACGQNLHIRLINKAQVVAHKVNHRFSGSLNAPMLGINGRARPQPKET